MIRGLPADQFFVDGEIVVETEGRLSFDALQMRLHPAESRINRLSGEIPARFVAFDALVWKGKTVTELRRLLDDADGAIEVALSDTKIQFNFGGVELTSKLIDGTFPDYQRVIPSGNDKIMEIVTGFGHEVRTVPTGSSKYRLTFDIVRKH